MTLDRFLYIKEQEDIVPKRIDACKKENKWSLVWIGVGAVS